MQSSAQPIQVALQALKKIATKGKTKKSLLENIDNVSSSVVLLNSSAPSSVAFNKLASVLRSPLVPLYSSYSDPALNFSAIILNKIITDGLKPCLLETYKKGTELQAGWELVANSLLSGVIDFLENEETERSKAAIAKAFYSLICDFFLKDDAQNNTGANLRYTAYTLLSDTAARHVPNQVKLRDEKLMGGHSLGMVISKTRDFAVLEVLFNLFARILPSFSASRKKHSSFIRDVFWDNFAEFPGCGVKIVRLLENTTGKDWEETTTKLFDMLSDADVSFPQPFDVDEVIVCENTYPQPEVSDRFYIDKTAFFINVQQEDGMYESLQIHYETVEEIRIIPTKGGMTAITVKLKASPKIGDQLLSTASGTLNLEVEVHSDDASRLSTALRHRKLVVANTGIRKVRTFKSSITESSARLDFEDGNEEELPLSPVKAIDVQKCVTSDTKDIVNCQLTPTRPSMGTHLRVSIFGRSDEELSEAEDVETLPLKVKSTGRGRKSFDITVTKPTEIIDLVDDEIEKRPKLSLGGSSSKKYIDAGAAVMKNNIMVKQGRSIRGSSPEKSTNVAEPAAASISIPDAPRPSDNTRNGAHSQHSKPAIAGSKEAFGDGDTENQPDDILAPATAGEVSNEARAIRPLKKHQATKLSAQVSAPHETPKLLPSSPASKKSLMRTKNTPSEKKAVKSRARKRTTAYTSQFRNENEPLKKKVRADDGNSEVESGLDEDCTRASSPPRKLSNHPLQKNEHRGSKGKRSHEQHKAPVNWNQVPKEATPDELAFKNDHSSPILISKLEGPVGSRAVETVVEKENDPGHNIQGGTLRASRSQYSARAPLRIAVLNPNTSRREPKLLDASTSSAVVSTGQNRRRRPLNTTSVLEPVRDSERKVDTKEAEDKELPSIRRAYPKGPNIEDTDLLVTIEDIDREPPITADSNFDGSGEVAGTGIPVNPLAASAVTFDNGDYVRRDEDGSNETINDARVGQAGPGSRTHTMKSPLEVAGVSEEKSEKMKAKSLGDVSGDLIEDDGEISRSQGLPILYTKVVCDPGIARQLLGTPTSEHHVSLVHKQPQSRPRPKVKFDSMPRYNKSLEPNAVFLTTEKAGGESGANTRSLEGNLTYRVAEGQPRRKHEDNLNKESGMEEIATVLNDIHNAIVSNIESKFRGVRSDVRIARDSLLHEAVADLHEMREESIKHFNNLFSLETEYANFSRKLGAGYEVVTSVNNDICSFIQQTVNMHDRGSLSKNMPQSLFVSALPGSFLKFTR
ncbi:hypothetical protein M0805_003028 [Coniferiporia weirii]|nr:hypothetical protein M0805_003028 [Coniferiporia weirii]